MCNATLEATCTIPQFAANGEWDASVMIKDKSKNQLWEKCPGILRVVSPRADTTPPEASSWVVLGESGESLLPGLSTSQQVTVTVHATDDVSGIDDPDADTRVNLYPISGPPGVSCSLDIVSGTPLDAVLEGECTIPGYARIGDWYASVMIADNAGNQLWKEFSHAFSIVYA